MLVVTMGDAKLDRACNDAFVAKWDDRVLLTKGHCWKKWVRYRSGKPRESTSGGLWKGPSVGAGEMGVGR